MRAAVVMPTHRRADRLPQVLRPVLEDPATAELVVVVDGADPATEQLLTTMAQEDSRLQWHVLEPSAGTARAKLLGARASTADVLVLLDDDVEALPGLVGRHLQHHVDTPHLVVVGSMPVQDWPEPDPLDSLAASIYRRNYVHACEEYSRDPAQVLAILWGGNISVRRADYLALEPQILRYPRLAHEDGHFGRVAAAAGLRGVYDPAAAAMHLHRRTWAGMLRESERQGRGQRALHLLHNPGTPFRDDELPEPLHPLVAQVVMRSDRPGVRRALLGALRRATLAGLRLGRTQTAIRLAFAATQITRRLGRRDAAVDALVAASAAEGEAAEQPLPPAG